MIQLDLKYDGVFLAEWDLYELILFHLIGNAVKFSNSGGSITVVLSPRETFIDSMSRTTLKTVVRDRGVGITDDKMKSIKQILAEQTSQKHIILSHAGVHQNASDNGVVGFGLSTASTLCQLLGGELLLSSFPWYKTEFEFTFDVKRTSSSLKANGMRQKQNYTMPEKIGAAQKSSLIIKKQSRDSSNMFTNQNSIIANAHAFSLTHPPSRLIFSDESKDVIQPN